MFVIDAIPSLKEDDGDIRFSVAAPKNQIADEYNRATGYGGEEVSDYVRVKENLLRSIFDGYRPLEQMQQLVEKSLGRKLRNSEDAYTLATLLPSLNAAMIDREETNFMIPMLRQTAEAVKRIKDEGDSFKEAHKKLNNYLLAKHVVNCFQKLVSLHCETTKSSDRYAVRGKIRWKTFCKEAHTRENSRVFGHTSVCGVAGSASCDEVASTGMPD